MAEITQKNRLIKMKPHKVYWLVHVKFYHDALMDSINKGSASSTVGLMITSKVQYIWIKQTSKSAKYNTFVYP